MLYYITYYIQNSEPECRDNHNLIFLYKEERY